jgi:hypothetical protein
LGRDLATMMQTPPAAAARSDLVTPTRSDVRRVLERIGKSAQFRRADRLVQLFSFLVETTLSADARYLKETTIGVSVFGRTPDYDPKTDTIVRSQAFRLRAKLTAYYALEGAEDPFVISIPKGQYKVVFTSRAGRPAERSAVWPERRSDGPRR